MTRIVSMFLFIFVAACGARTDDHMFEISGNEVPLTGAWELVQIGSDPPSSSNIQSWVVTIDKDHKWHYEATMSGPWDGMRLLGDGTWKLSSGGFEYTAGVNRGTSRLDVSDTTLVLSPDPVITLPGGKGSVDCTYKRRS